MVSRTEMKGGLFDRFESLGNICLIEKGSIALKLGLLAAGACDFVVSLEHKNIWDIAAGCILASQRGMGFYHNGQLVTSLTEQSYTGVLLWARHEHVEQLNSIFLSS